MTAPTMLDRRVGTAALVLTIGDVTVPATAVGPVTIRHGRPSPDRRPETPTITLQVKSSALPAPPPIGTPLTVEIGDDARAAFGLVAGTAPDDAARHRFVGTVTDPVVRGDVIHLTAAGRRAQLGRRYVGDTPWPAESDGARAARILALAGATGIGTWDVTTDGAAGWSTSFLGTPTADSVDAGDPLGLRITWLPAADPAVPNTSTAFRVVSGLVVGRSYTVLAEVYVPPGQPGVEIDPLFMGRSATIPPASRWQTVTYTFVNTDPDGEVSVGLAADLVTPRPAGTYAICRRFTVYESTRAVVGILDPGTVDVLARDVDRRYALDLLDELAVDSSAELAELRDGRLEWHDAEHRRNAAPVVELAADQVLGDVEWAQSVDGLVNDLRVVYGETPLDVDGNPLDRAAVEVVDRISLDDPAIGPAEASIDSQLVAEVDATALATRLVARQSRPAWRLDGLSVDLLRTASPAVAAALLGVEFGALLAVTGAPVSAPIAAAGRLWVEGWVETITRTGWRLDFDVSDYARSGPPPTWAEVDPAATWASIPADVSWLAANYWRAPAVSAGRWVDLPARRRWTDVDPAATWATFTGR